MAAGRHLLRVPRPLPRAAAGRLRSSAWCSPATRCCSRSSSTRSARPSRGARRLARRPADRRDRRRGRHRARRPRRLPLRRPAHHGQAAHRHGADLDGRRSTSPTSSGTTCGTSSRSSPWAAIGLLSLALTGVADAGDDLGAGAGWASRTCPATALLTWVVGLALALVVDTVVFLWLLRVVPSISHPLRAAAARRAVRRRRLRGAQAARRPLPVADLRQRHRVDLRRRGRPARLDQPRRPVRLLHGRVDGDPPPVEAAAPGRGGGGAAPDA